MARIHWPCATLAIWFACAFGPAVFGQTDEMPRLGVGFSVGTLGVGAEALTSITRHSDVRAGFNGFEFTATASKDGITYNGGPKLLSADAFYDYYLFGPFHVSGGALLYDGISGHATASVPGGRSFTLGGTQYFSSPADPITGTANLNFNKAAPGVLLGFGNLLPRNARQWGIRFEFGGVYQGSAKTTLNFTGSTCNAQLSGCQTVASNASFQNNVQSEQTKINNALKSINFWPIISLSIGFKFR
jgi:hypothetical protein